MCVCVCLCVCVFVCVVVLVWLWGFCVRMPWGSCYPRFAHRRSPPRDLASALTAFTALKRLAKVDFLGEFMDEVRGAWGLMWGGWGAGD